MKNVLSTLKYILLTIQHKWFVLIFGLRLGVPLWQLIIHDLSKFSRHEAPHYGRKFFGDASDPLGFARAWLHHQNANPHHWEYWIPRTIHNRQSSSATPNTSMRMPERYVREMVADWLAASRTYEGTVPDKLSEWVWFQQNNPLHQLAPETATLVLEILEDFFESDLVPFTVQAVLGESRTFLQADLDAEIVKVGDMIAHNSANYFEAIDE